LPVHPAIPLAHAYQPAMIFCEMSAHHIRFFLLFAPSLLRNKEKGGI
jgi:hypothetical protein